MSIKNIAAAMIAPAAIAGVALSTGAAANAATVHNAAPKKYNQWVTVRSGDTLSKIAAEHHMSWEALYMAPPNKSRIHDPNLVTVGERLRIPADPKLWASKYVPPRAPAEPVSTQAPTQGSTAQGSAAQGSTAQGSTAQGSTAQGSTAQGSTAQGSAAQGSASQAPVQSTGGTTSSSGGGSSFQRCVAWRESGNNATSPDGLYGILPSTWASLGHSGTAGQASVAQQNAAFNQLYAKYGAQPWAPYDGC
jgi:LysM repeat protein